MRPFLLQGRGRALIAASGLLAAAAVGVATVGPAAMAAPLTGAAQSAGSRAAVTASAGGAPTNKVTWSVLPATAKGADNRILFNYGIVAPGSTIKDYVEVVNRSAQPAAFSVYATDAIGTSLDNSLLLAKPGAKPVDIGAWTSFPGGAAQLSAVIPGDQGIIEPFTVKVPLQATPGDHTGAMTAQVTIQTHNAKGLAVSGVYRIAVPVEFRVSGALRSGMQVQSVSTGFSDPLNPFGTGSATISYTVVNTGNVKLTGTQAVTVSALFGHVTVKPPALPTILPGDSIRITAHAAGLFPFGPMTAKVTVTPAWVPNTPPLSQIAAVASDSASLFAMPWSLLGLILLLVAIGAGAWYYRRWRRRLRKAELAAVAARARRDTEQRLIGKKAAANGHGGTPKAADLAEVSSNPAEATAPGGTQDGGGTAAAEGTTE